MLILCSFHSKGAKARLIDIFRFISSDGGIRHRHGTLLTMDSSTVASNYRFVVIGELIDVTSLDRVGITAEGGMTISSEDRGNPYLVTFQVMNQMSLSASRQDGIIMWALKIAGISLVILVLGMFLFLQIEKRYRHIYEG